VSEVTVWLSGLWLNQVTFSFSAIETSPGWKAKSTIETFWSTAEAGAAARIGAATTASAASGNSARPSRAPKADA
jgi:hypothetical protein